MTDREINLHCAHVYLREAHARRVTHPGFSATLIEWAGNARRRAMPTRPAQGDLFGAMA